ncbi:MAG: membrane protein insertion efficiency factor YidD [candidate division WOR-3 bacterium]
MLKIFVVNLIKIYKIFISPILPSSCKFYPSCSEYSIISIEKYGIIKGFILSLWRILRCNPFSKGGVNFPEDDARRIFK